MIRKSTWKSFKEVKVSDQKKMGVGQGFRTLDMSIHMMVEGRQSQMEIDILEEVELLSNCFQDVPL